ncbi:MAG: efflux RND transporter periplasmic adaptor subunit [Gammaproteobacteria bacterium]|uniref:efflux RND transporter periplasmic adaptor subunit n=1 Tax=Rhodoferax sp. TaxID=50421 RepID=UPI00185BDBF9|nr:efflux RND transporter periplasmic adaptor subunit [Rhodoferax sp.]MBU3897631.1 efflux RND transporter periplasmic adaptor subunit [Gammaproteobacteria bacterium]MBA3058257.1 efflux RND transporter periplasmic adaptor subunit [Rhodoferax sp.]MBU3999464.1 efflux RND transporter periplasmic adaptor subunit [Gammaproteobacteria bacterium]MBU4017725.1 efflux RND transporter periplasmic adaptor subunit [Gammaproteobacteria bacterium]MBU4081168.1 efflux RND transporter periplasmic adaptor subunit
MKPWLKWALTALVLAVLASGVWRALSARKVQQEAVAKMATQNTQAVLQLSAADVVQVTARELVTGVALSGALKAVNTAMVKARVPGELQGLTVREGDAVKAGQIIARVDATEYNARVQQAQQQAQAAKAQVDIARRNFDNNRSLVQQGFISKTAVDTSTASLAAAEATYRAAQAGAQVAAKSVQDTVLRAPISGLISQRLAQPGERVGVEARIVEIVDLRQLELEASLSASESVAVRVGQSAVLQIEGVSPPVTAKVIRINPSTTVGSRAVLVYLSVEAAPGLRQGLFAQGTLGTERVQALAVPLSAVRTDQPQPYVQLISGNKVLHQTVQMGARGERDGQTLVAIKGLVEHASVLVGSVGPLRAGTVVQVAAPAVPAQAASVPSGGQ